MSVDVNDIFVQTLLPVLATILCGIASAVLAMGYRYLSKKWGIEIESRDREALHSALVSGINLGVSKSAQTLGPIPKIQVGNPITAMAVQYVLRSVPDAVRRLNLTEARITEMVLAKAQQVTGTTSPSVSPPVST